MQSGQGDRARADGSGASAFGSLAKFVSSLGRPRQFNLLKPYDWWHLYKPSSCLLRHAFQVRKDAILDPLLVVRLICSVSVVHQAAEVAELIDEGVQLCDVICDIPHAYPPTSVRLQGERNIAHEIAEVYSNTRTKPTSSFAERFGRAHTCGTLDGLGNESPSTHYFCLMPAITGTG